MRARRRRAASEVSAMQGDTRFIPTPSPIPLPSNKPRPPLPPYERWSSGIFRNAALTMGATALLGFGACALAMRDHAHHQPISDDIAIAAFLYAVASLTLSFLQLRLGHIQVQQAQMYRLVDDLPDEQIELLTWVAANIRRDLTLRAQPGEPDAPRAEPPQ